MEDVVWLFMIWEYKIKGLQKYTMSIILLDYFCDQETFFDSYTWFLYLILILIYNINKFLYDVGLKRDEEITFFWKNISLWYWWNSDGNLMCARFFNIC